MDPVYNPRCSKRSPASRSGCRVDTQLNRKPGNFTTSCWFFTALNTVGFSICSVPPPPQKKSQSEESLRRVPHYHPGNAAASSTAASVWRLCCHGCGSGGGQLFFCAAEGGRQRPSSAHSSSLSAFHHSSIHLSVRSSLHPSVHIGLLLHTWIHPSRLGRRPRFSHRRLLRASPQVFQNWLKCAIQPGRRGDGDIARCTEGRFFFSVPQDTLILSIRPTYTEWKAIHPPRLRSSLEPPMESEPDRTAHIVLGIICSRSAVTLGSLCIPGIPPRCCRPSLVQAENESLPEL